MDTDFYKKLLEQSPFGYAYYQLVTDEDGTPVDYIFLEVNAEFERLTGLSRREILNKSVSQVLPKLQEDKFDWVKYYGEVAQQGESRTFEQYSPPLERYYKVDAYSPQKGYFVTILSDITDRIETERALKVNEERLSLAMQGTGAGLWDWDMQRGAVYFSPLWKQMLGYGEDEIENTFEGWKKLWHPEDTPKIEQAIEDYLQGRRKYYQVEHRLRHKNGEWRWILTRGTIAKDEQGEPVRWIGTNIDITATKQLQEDFRKTSDFLDTVLESIRDGISVLEPDMTIRHVNRRMEEWYGPADTLIGKKCYQVFQNRARMCKDCPVARVMESKQPASSIVHWGPAQGIEWVESYGYPMFDKESGEVTGVIEVIRDITEQKQAAEAVSEANWHLEEQTVIAKEMAAQAEMASQAKSDFLANMSHEIRTPMNAVVGFTDLLLTSNLTPIQRQYLENVHSSADSLLVLINDILDFSKIEAGRLELELTTLNLHDHLEKAMDIVTFIAHEKGLELILDLDPELPHLVSADSVRLNQILTNLLTNAVKFTEKGEVELRARRASADNPSTVEFTVRDTGIGMSEEQREKIFDSFTQADHSTTRKYGGTGLGLSISTSLVEQMGGHLNVESTPNEGSSFFFSLTFAVEEVKPPTEQVPLQLKTALIIDDNRHNRTILDAMCHYWGVESHSVGNGLEALEYLKSGAAVDVVVLDYHMPFMDGLDVASKIRDDLGLSAEDLPIIFLYSSADDPRVLERCKELGIDYRLAKPIKMTQLQEVLERVQNRGHDEIGRQSLGQTADKSVGGGPGSGPGNVQGSGQKYPVSSADADKTVEKITVLVAEDNPPNMLLAKGLLAKMFSEVTIIGATEGNEAVELFTQNLPNLILMDVQMPGKDGYSATADIRAYEAEHEGHTPIIALTAGALEGDRERCLQAGMDDYIAKPIQINVLREKVQYWVYEKKKKPAAEDEGSSGANVEKASGARAAAPDTGQFEEHFEGRSEDSQLPSLQESREYLYQQGHDDEIIDQMFEMLLERGPELQRTMQSAVEVHDLESLKKA